MDLIIFGFIKNNETMPTRNEQIFIHKVNQIIESRYQDYQFGLQDLCEGLQLGRTQVYRKEMAITQKAPSELIRAYRIEKAKELLITTNAQIADIAFEVGFRDAGYFAKVYKKYFGYSPNETLR